MDIDSIARDVGSLNSGKRKWASFGGSVDEDHQSPAGNDQDYRSQAPAYKKARHGEHIPGSTSCVTDLPPEILQRIFSFVHPISLGGLLRVCRLFNVLVDPEKDILHLASTTPGTKLRKQNEIWIQSRRLHLPGYPRPPHALTELDTWRLLRVTRCQFCQKKAKSKPAFMGQSPWNGGPGPQHVRTIWPFRIRSCGPCLEIKLRKVSNILSFAGFILTPVGK
jgi:hypothetical protein